VNEYYNFIFASTFIKMAKDIKKITPYEDVNSGKKDQVTTMFDKVAPYYDFLNRLLSLRIDILWRRKAIKSLATSKPNHILDIATGTADLAIEAARQLKPKSIIGLDISANMLKIGDKKILKKGLDDVIKLELGDSENLRFEDASFDAVTAGFGVRNFENLEKGLAEMYRILKPGGNLMILEFSKPYVFPLKQGFNLYFKYMLPVIGKVVSKDPKAYQYLYESVQAFPDYNKFAEILKNLGFKKTTFKPLSFGICTIYSATK
jgi:demethylmenaquinone methyltransferase/2-methoxy-6-polyprenyl-1,4-benzoquinol methylase